MATGFSGLLLAVTGKIFNKKILYEVKRSDCVHPFRLRIPSSDVGTYCQIYHEEEYSFFVKDQPVTIVDAGANIGISSIYFANRYPHSRVIAIEPESGNFSLLKENVAPYPNIIAVHAALWNRVGEIELVDTGHGYVGYMTDTKENLMKMHKKACDTVRAITVDSMIQEFKIERIDIFKVDIEGAEKEVFFEKQSWIDKVDTIIIELHERFRAGCAASVYSGLSGFVREWEKGENIYLSRGNCSHNNTFSS